MKFENELYGAWEKRGVIGTRIEIEKNTIIILWRGGEVLKTTFRSKLEDDGKITLIPKETGMKYKGSFSSYATVEKLVYDSGKLEFCHVFPITGESTEVLEKTDNTRYGNFDVADKSVLKYLAGKWAADDGGTTFVFSGNVLDIGGFKKKITVLKGRDRAAQGFRIVDIDPAADMIFGYSRIFFTGYSIEATVHVCDAPSITEILHKVQE